MATQTKKLDSLVDYEGEKVGPEQAIRERIHLHPNALVNEIVGMMELDGVRVSADLVQRIMDEQKPSPAA